MPSERETELRVRGSPSQPGEAFLIPLSLLANDLGSYAHNISAYVHYTRMLTTSGAHPAALLLEQPPIGLVAPLSLTSTLEIESPVEN